MSLAALALAAGAATVAAQDELTLRSPLDLPLVLDGEAEAVPAAAAPLPLPLRRGTPALPTALTDPFTEPAVPVESDAFAAAPPEAGEEDEAATGRRSPYAAEDEARRRAPFAEPETDPLETSALAFSGRDSLAAEAERRARDSLAASDGALPEPDEALPRRPAPEVDPFAPLGIEAGGLTLFPELEIGGVVTDNVHQAATGRRADVALRLAPALGVRSDWVRHAASFDGRGEFLFYDQASERDAITAEVTGSVRLDLRRTTSLTATAGYNLDQASSSTSEVPDDAVGLRSDETVRAELALDHRLNRLSGRLIAGVNRATYGDVALAGGSVEDNADRAYVEPVVGLRIGYEASPAMQPFAEAVYAPRIHDRRLDRSGLRRDSDGVTLRAGLAFDLDTIWSGDVALVYTMRDYDDPALDTVTAWGLDANVTWRPSRITAVTFTAATDIGESAAAGIGGSTTWRASAGLAHLLRDNLTATAALDVAYTDYPGAADEVSLTVRAGLGYRIRREMELVAGYEYSAFRPDTGPGYDEHRVSAGVRFRL